MWKYHRHFNDMLISSVINEYVYILYLTKKFQNDIISYMIGFI